MTDNTGRHITVGADGSVSALHAVRWAAAEAVRLGTALRIVHSYLPPWLAYPGVVASTGVAEDFLVQESQRVLHEAAYAAREVAPALEVGTEAVFAGSIPTLLTESGTARMLVVGAHGTGGFSGMLLGSTASAVTAHAACPVVVVRGAEPGLAPPEQGPVIVGVDGSELSEAAVAFAFDHASRTGAPLVAVHTWSFTVLLPDLEAEVSRWSTAVVAPAEQRALAERLAGWQEKYPDVQVRRESQQDAPARRLLAEAQYGRLLVVGSRGWGGFTGMLLGSTSRTLVRHSPCPVAVVRGPQS